MLSFGSSTGGVAAPDLDSKQFRPPEGPVGRLGRPEPERDRRNGSVLPAAQQVGDTRSQQKAVFGMSRREFMTIFSHAAIWPLAARAEQPANIRRIGYLDYGAGLLPSGG